MSNNLTKGLIAAAIAITGAFEGVSYFAYQDSVSVWTICYGSTLGVKPGDKKSYQECRDLFKSDLNEHNTPLADISQDLPDNVHLAALDLAYNIGTTAFKNSTMYDYLLVADYPNACMEIPRWRFAGGKDCAIPANNCRGIVKRREIGTQLCLGQMSINDALFALGEIPLDREVIDALDISEQ